MKAFSVKHAALGLALVGLAPFAMGADGSGCGDVVVGSDEPCQPTGCSGTVCADTDVATTCEWTDSYACYGNVGICERGSDGTCGWRDTPELAGCLANPNPAPCVVGGCSGQLCGDEELTSDCSWLPEYQCYQDVGVCERGSNGSCGWRETPELTACLADPRVPVSGACIKNAGDACTSDADCTAGGCGGELCYNPAASEGVSDCECTAPSLGCGCVQGQCTWFE